MTLTLPNNIANQTPADAVQVEQNYNVIEDYVNRELIARNGAVAMTHQLQLVGDPTQPLNAATKAYVDAVVPVGVVLPFGGIVAPAGKWALCNGAQLAVSTYPLLFAALQYRFGGSAGTFNLPNLAGKIPIGVDTEQDRFNTSGKTGGTWVTPVPFHHHAMPHTHPIDHDHATFVSGQEKEAHAHPISLATDMEANHDHVVVGISNSTPGTFGRFMRGTSGVGAAADVTSSSEGTHNHLVVGNTGTESSVHHHDIDVPAHSGASGAASAADTADAGTAGVEQLPPYVTLTYIIRID